MLKILLKNLFRKKATRLYPFEKRMPFEHARGELCIEVEKCIFCGICARKCPSACIEVDRSAGTWKCDPFACVSCGVCVEVCPKKCLYQKPTYRPATTERETLVATRS